MPEENARIRLAINNEETMMPRAQKKVIIEDADDVRESGQLTLIYRGVIGLLLAIVIGLIAWEGQGITTGVSNLKNDISAFKADVAVQIGSLKTDYATNAVILMNQQQQLGEANGKLVATTDRFNRLGDMINVVRDRLTILETKYDDQIKNARPNP